MSLPTKITVIGAGSASFGENTLSAIVRSKKLRGSTLAFVDRNADSLDIVHRLANRLNREWDCAVCDHSPHGSSRSISRTANLLSMRLKWVRAKIYGKRILRSRSNMACVSLMRRMADPVALHTQHATSVRSCRSRTTWNHFVLRHGLSTSPTR